MGLAQFLASRIRAFLAFFFFQQRARHSAVSHSGEHSRLATRGAAARPKMLLLLLRLLRRRRDSFLRRCSVALLSIALLALVARPDGVDEQYDRRSSLEWPYKRWEQSGISSAMVDCAGRYLMGRYQGITPAILEITNGGANVSISFFTADDEDDEEEEAEEPAATRGAGARRRLAADERRHTHTRRMYFPVRARRNRDGSLSPIDVDADLRRAIATHKDKNIRKMAIGADIKVCQRKQGHCLPFLTPVTLR